MFWVKIKYKKWKKNHTKKIQNNEQTNNTNEMKWKKYQLKENQHELFNMVSFCSKFLNVADFVACLNNSGFFFHSL